MEGYYILATKKTDGWLPRKHDQLQNNSLLLRGHDGFVSIVFVDSIYHRPTTILSTITIELIEVLLT